MAAYHGHHKVIPFLLRAGSKIDAQSDDGRTPLHEASAQGHEKAVRELLKGGPNIHIRNSWLSPSPKVSEHGGKDCAYECSRSGIWVYRQSARLLPKIQMGFDVIMAVAGSWVLGDGTGDLAGD